MSGESDSDFVKSVEELLDAGKTIDAKAIFCATEHNDKIKNNSWDLIPAVSKFISVSNNKNNVEVFNCCQQLLNSIADISNPEEALLQFIEEVEEADCDLKFITLLDPLRKVLQRIPKKLSISLAWGFNSIQCYLNKYEVSDSENLQGKEKLLLDNSEETQKINQLYQSVIKFYDLLLKEISLPVDADDQISVVLQFLIRLLGKPIIYLDVEIFDNIKSRARLSSENLVDKILNVCCDPISLLDNRLLANNDAPKLNNLGLASLYYLIFAENIHLERIPKVYDSVYIFQNSLHLVSILLKVNHQIVVEKGLKLVGSLLKYVKHSKLSYQLLESPDHGEFCKALVNIIVYNELENFRKLGLQVYETYLSCFEPKGFYLILYNLIPELTHSGLKGYTISLYKEMLVKDFENIENNFVRGQKLLSILRKFCFLHKKEESNLVELSDEIIASLNLLRYLIIRDKLNTTQIWDYIPILDDTYLTPLRKGIELSRAHFKLKIKEIEEEKTIKKADDDINVLVKGESLSKMSKKEKIEVLNYSLTVFDIIDSLLSRLLECIEMK